MSFLNSLLAAGALASTILPHPTPHHKSFSWAEAKYLVAFGDSYTYVQGTHGRQNFSFIGDALNLGFSPEGLLSDLIVQNQTGTAEGGPNYVEFLTRCAVAANTTTDPRTCERQLWDFAFAGADISTAYTPLHHNFTVSLVNQTRQFAEYADPVLSTLIDKDNTLVDVWIGINDIGDSAKYNVSFPAFYEDLVSTLFDAIEENVYSKGYRAYLFLLLPPLNRTPPNLIRAAGPLPNATMIEWYNEALQQHAWKFKAAHADTDVLVFDTTTFLNYVLDHPTEYGITNTTDYCAGYDQPYVNADPGRYGCAPLDQYFWFNTGHMTSHTHEILAAELEKFLSDESDCGWKSW